MRMRWFVVTLITVLALPSFTRGQNTERGAALGGIGGALAGAAIGKNNGDTGAGALIGGAVGLITGAAIGNSADERDRRAAYQNQQMYLYSRAVSSSDVVSMSQNLVSEEVIINHIRENGVQHRLAVSEVIALHRQGVSERVITAMQNAPEGGPAPLPPRPVYRAVPAPVVVEQFYYAPRPYWGPPPYYYNHHPHPRSYVQWGISFGR